MIYNITSNTWITQYTPPASYIAARAKESPSTPSPGTSPNSVTDDSSSSSSGAIAGGVVGGIALISAGVLLFIFRKRLHRPSLVNTTGDSDDQDERKLPPQSAQQQEDEELTRLRLQLQNQQEQLELQRRLLQLQLEQQLQQQQQQQQPLAFQQPHQYQDAAYYQPQSYYSTGVDSNSMSVFNTYDATAGLNTFSTPPPPVRPTVAPLHGGYVEGNSSYVESTPVIYHQSPAGASMTVMPVIVPAVTLPAKKNDYDNYIEERPPGNPHAIVTP